MVEYVGSLWLDLVLETLRPILYRRLELAALVVSSFVGQTRTLFTRQAAPTTRLVKSKLEKVGVFLLRDPMWGPDRQCHISRTGAR